MFTTLNNDIAKRIITYAADGKYRFCAYGLYNHYDLTFDEATYERLFSYVVELLGDKFRLMYLDISIDACVRNFIMHELIEHEYEKHFG